MFSTGGPMYGAQAHVRPRSSRVTSTLSAELQHRRAGTALDSYEGNRSGPLVEFHREAFLNQGILQGSGLLLRGGQWSSTACDACYDLDTSTITDASGRFHLVQARVWAGSHDVQTGFLAMPRNNYEKKVEYLNDGFTLEEQPPDRRRTILPAEPCRSIASMSSATLNQHTASGRDKDIGVYAQDMWKPTSRMTVTVGVRVDFVRRFDALRDLQRQSSTEDRAPRWASRTC